MALTNVDPERSSHNVLLDFSVFLSQIASQDDPDFKRLGSLSPKRWPGYMMVFLSLSKESQRGLLPSHHDLVPTWNHLFLRSCSQDYSMDTGSLIALVADSYVLPESQVLYLSLSTTDHGRPYLPDLLSVIVSSCVVLYRMGGNPH